MRSQNIKYNLLRKVGGASCLLLLALTFIAMNPGAHLSAFAEEILDEDISTQADTPSTVGISFSPASGSASLSPITSAGQSAQIKVLATVNVQKSGGYSVYVKSNSQNLVGKRDNGNVIPGLQGTATYTNLPVNTWGYYATEGTVVADDVAYKAISTTGNGDKVAENTSNKILFDTKTIALSFVAKVGTDKPADTYENKVTLSVVSSPAQLTLIDIDNLQDMTTAICENTSQLTTKQLKDIRDGKYYWVTKLADRSCWMTQNLDLDLSTSMTLTPATSDVSSNWTPEYSTAVVADSSTILTDNTGQGSWSLGDYRITNPNTSNDCGYLKSSAASCPEQFTTYITPTSVNGDELAHYILGNHYQWNAATAGTGGTITGGEATSSICPKGWKLPTSGSDGEFELLATALGGVSSTDNVTQAPFYGVRGGDVNQSLSLLFNLAGAYGYYWSSTPVSNDNDAYYFGFGSTIDVFPSDSGLRQYGLSIRCVAR